MPNIDTSLYYDGDSGRRYFERQNVAGDLGGRLNAAKFAKWVSPGHQVLDFGCGGGWLLRHLTVKERIGVEPNLSAHATCRANGIEVYADLSCLAGRTFDRVISHHCLEHVPHPVDALRRLRQHLRPDGLLIIVVPIDDWRVQRDATGDDKDHHLHTWTPRLMANTLTDAEYRVVTSAIVTHAWPWRWAMWYKWLPNRLFECLCGAWSIMLRRRQLFVVAQLKPTCPE